MPSFLFFVSPPFSLLISVRFGSTNSSQFHGHILAQYQPHNKRINEKGKTSPACESFPPSDWIVTALPQIVKETSVDVVIRYLETLRFCFFLFLESYFIGVDWKQVTGRGNVILLCWTRKHRVFCGFCRRQLYLYRPFAYVLKGTHRHTHTPVAGFALFSDFRCIYIWCRRLQFQATFSNAISLVIFLILSVG